jgi:hypothetical protein
MIIALKVRLYGTIESLAGMKKLRVHLQIVGQHEGQAAPAESC